MKTKQVLKLLIKEEILKRLYEADTMAAPELATSLGLVYGYFGRWLDPNTGKVVAKTIDGELVRCEPEDPEDPEIAEPVKFDTDREFKNAGEGHWRHQGNGKGHINPGWNKGLALSGDVQDVAFDGHAEETVKKLLAKVGDPNKLIKWLVKKFGEETPNGKKRIMQYLGIMKQMGFGDSEPTEPKANAQQPAVEQPKQDKKTVGVKGRDLFA